MPKLIPSYSRGCLEDYNSIGYVIVKDKRAPENLVVHYSYGDGNWQTTQGQFKGLTEKGNQIWKFVTPDLKPSFHYHNFTTQFAVKYTKDGETYWANNGGKDYFIRMTNVPT